MQTRTQISEVIDHPFHGTDAPQIKVAHITAPREWILGDEITICQIVFEGATAEQIRNVGNMMLQFTLAKATNIIGEPSVFTLAHFPLSYALDKKNSVRTFEDTVAVQIDLSWFPRPDSINDFQQEVKCILHTKGLIIPPVRSILLRTIFKSDDSS